MNENKFNLKAAEAYEIKLKELMTSLEPHFEMNSEISDKVSELYEMCEKAVFTLHYLTQPLLQRSYDQDLNKEREEKAQADKEQA